MSHDREYQIKYRKLHREKNLLWKKKYREKNKEKLKQYAREYKLKLKRMENTNKLIEEENKSEKIPWEKETTVVRNGKVFRKRPMTQERFDAIKKMAFEGHTPTEIHKQLDEPFSTINRTKQAKDLVEFRAIGAATARRSFTKNTIKKRQNLPLPPPIKIIPEPTPEKEVVPTTETDAIKKILNAVDEYVAIQVEVKLKEKLKKLLEL